MSRILVILALASVCNAAVFGTLVPSTDYYVSQNTGSDSNNGTSPSTPFLTIGKLQSVLLAGTTASICGGSSSASPYKYQEQLTLPAANIAIVGYCEAPPIFDASGAISSGSWSTYGGCAAISQSTISTPSDIGGFIWPFENSAPMTQAASLVALCTAPGQYFVVGNGSAIASSRTLYVNPTGGDIGVNAYDYNVRDFAIFSQFKATISNVRTQRNFHNDGSLQVGQGSFLSDIVSLYGTKHNILIHQGTTINNVTASYGYYAGMGSVLLVYNDNTPTGLPLTINNLTCTMTTYTTSFDCLYGHTNTGGQFGLLTLSGANITNVQTGAVALAVSRAVFSNLNVSNVQTAVTAYADTSVVNSTLSASTGNAISIAAPVSFSLAGSTVSGASANQAVVYSFNIASDLTITNTTIVNPSSGYGIWMGPAGALLTMSGNSFTGGNNSYIAVSPGIVSDHNNEDRAWSVNVNGAFRNRTTACSLFSVECNSTP